MRPMSRAHKSLLLHKDNLWKMNFKSDFCGDSDNVCGTWCHMNFSIKLNYNNHITEKSSPHRVWGGVNGIRSGINKTMPLRNDLHIPTGLVCSISGQINSCELTYRHTKIPVQSLFLKFEPWSQAGVRGVPLVQVGLLSLLHESTLILQLAIGVVADAQHAAWRSFFEFAAAPVPALTSRQHDRAAKTAMW